MDDPNGIEEPTAIPGPRAQAEKEQLNGARFGSDHQPVRPGAQSRGDDWFGSPSVCSKSFGILKRLVGWGTLPLPPREVEEPYI